MRARLPPLLGILIALTGPMGGQSGSIDPALLAGVRLRAIGPTSVGGRVDDFAVGRAPGQPDAIYVRRRCDTGRTTGR